MTEFDAMSDEDLDDIGMERCTCGTAYYSEGVSDPHCELDTRYS